MPVVVRIPTPLRKFTAGQAEVEVSGRTVGEVLDNLYDTHCEFRTRICDESGQLRRFVNLYLNDEDIRFLSNLDTPVKDGDRLSIVPSIAGGGFDGRAA